MSLTFILTSLLFGAGGAAALWFAYQFRRQGSLEAENEALKRTVDDAKSRAETDDAIAKLGDADRRERLNQWMRDD